MRGKGGQRGSKIYNFGITPAYAGKSSTVFRSYLGIQDHPRLCGEKENVMDPLISTIGSPPPMRGKVRVREQRFHDVRITPAYAGKRLHDRRRK